MQVMINGKAEEIAVFQLSGLEVRPFKHGVIHLNRNHLRLDALRF